MSDHLSIAHWSADDQPREKLRDKGASALSNAELLAILVRTGTEGVSAVNLMQQLLSDCNNNLNTLGKKTIRELMDYKGMGEAKAITILAACELAKRSALEKAEERHQLQSAMDIYEYMRPLMGGQPVEEAWILLMNHDFRLIRQMRISQGGITETAVDVRVIVKEALLANATVVALCHNHPSGSIKPSRKDDQLTENVKKACDTMRIHLLDHLIITDGNYYSYHEQGKL